MSEAARRSLEEARAAWTELEAMIDARNYDRAIALAIDLCDAAPRDDSLASFDDRVGAVSNRQARRRSFFERWRRASGRHHDGCPRGRDRTLRLDMGAEVQIGWRGGEPHGLNFLRAPDSLW